VTAAAAIPAMATQPSVVAISNVCLRTATADDASAIHALIAAHVAEGHLLPREREEVSVHAYRFAVATREARVVACAELAPLSRDVSEVRSLVVSDEARTLGIGHNIVDELVGWATSSGFQKLCAFTHAPAYFVQFGFSIVPHIWLPEKILTDCHACPHFRRCGQHAMLRELHRTTEACVPLAALHD